MHAELKLTCKILDFPFDEHGKPIGFSGCKVAEDKEIPFCITNNNIQIYHADECIFIDKEIAIKLLEIIANK